MNVYSELFYDKDLKAMVNDVDSVEAEIVKRVRPILSQDENGNMTHGVFFVGVEGRSQKCADSPSWLNKAEANNVSYSCVVHTVYERNKFRFCNAFVRRFYNF